MEDLWALALGFDAKARGGATAKGSRSSLQTTSTCKKDRRYSRLKHSQYSCIPLHNLVYLLYEILDDIIYIYNVQI